MQRREFSQGAAGLAGAAALAWALPAQAQLKPQAGKDYVLVNPPAPVQGADGKIEVIEFFWYSCSHCNAFEPMLNAWAKQLPKDVHLRRMHVAFNESFVPQQRLYFTLEAMGLVDKLHGKVFEAIHEKRFALGTGQAIGQWVADQGIDVPLFVEKYNSPEVLENARLASSLQNAYQVEGVPAMGIAGRYYTDGSLTRSMGRCLQAVDYLIEELRRGRHQ